MQKLKLTAYKDNKYQEELTDCIFVAPINPGEFTEKVRVIYGAKPWLPVVPKGGGNDTKLEVQGNGSPDNVVDGDSSTWEKTDRRTFSITLVLDATGAVMVDGSPLKEPVERQIARLKWTLLDGTKPRWVKLVYDSITWKVRLDVMNVSYTLFKPDGKCVRASVSLEFIEELIWGSQAEADAGLNQEVRAKIGDSSTKIDQMAEKEYNDQFQYLKIAKANKVKYFRSLVPGFVYKIFPKL